MKKLKWGRKTDGSEAAEHLEEVGRHGFVLGSLPKAGQMLEDAAALDELRERLRRSEALVEALQFTISELRRDREHSHKLSILDGLTAPEPTSLALTHDKPEDEPHALLEIAAEARVEPPADATLPDQLASTIYVEIWHEYDEEMIDTSPAEAPAAEPDAQAPPEPWAPFASGEKQYKPGALKKKYLEKFTLHILEKHAAALTEFDAAKNSLNYEIDVLKSRLAELKSDFYEREEAARGEILRLSERCELLRRELEETAGEAAQIKRDHERIEAERNRLSGAIVMRENEIRALLTRLEQTKAPAAPRAEQVPADGRPALPASAPAQPLSQDILIARMEQEPSIETILALRKLFASDRRFDEGVRVFRKMLTNSRNSRFLPALCLVIGEFFRHMGRAEEANFYLTNPLIKNDSFAQHLLRNMKK